LLDSDILCPVNRTVVIVEIEPFQWGWKIAFGVGQNGVGQRQG
jgi:hypothetical protein